MPPRLDTPQRRVPKSGPPDGARPVTSSLPQGAGPGAEAHDIDPDLKAIPIVAVTSYALLGDRERCLAAGAEGYLEKPIDPESFAIDVERFLRPPHEGPVA